MAIPVATTTDRESEARSTVLREFIRRSLLRELESWNDVMRPAGPFAHAAPAWVVPAKRVSLSTLAAGAGRAPGIAEVLGENALCLQSSPRIREYLIIGSLAPQSVQVPKGSGKVHLILFHAAGWLPPRFRAESSGEFPLQAQGGVHLFYVCDPNTISDPSALSNAPQETRAREETSSFREAYHKLGTWKGSDSSTSSQEQAEEVFLKAGRSGAQYLVDRISAEWDSERLYAVSFLLAELAEEAVPLISSRLETTSSPNQILTLLAALSEMEALNDTDGHLGCIIERFTGIGNPASVREAAYRALARLNSDSTEEILRAAEQKETEPYLKKLVSDLLRR